MEIPSLWKQPLRDVAWKWLFLIDSFEIASKNSKDYGDEICCSTLLVSNKNIFTYLILVCIPSYSCVTILTC